jgi:hypothetical protein
MLSVTSLLMLLAGVQAASAATLFTTPAHTTRVTVGSTFSTTETDLQITSGSTTIETCTHGVLDHTVVQNNHAAVLFAVTGGSASGCTPVVLTMTLPWTVSVSGTGTVIGTNTCWHGSISAVRFDMFGGLYTGNLTSGVTSCQPTATGSPISLKLDTAGTVTGPLTGAGKLSTFVDFLGAAASYSWTN